MNWYVVSARIMRSGFYETRYLSSGGFCLSKWGAIRYTSREGAREAALNEGARGVNVLGIGRISDDEMAAYEAGLKDGVMSMEPALRGFDEGRNAYWREHWKARVVDYLRTLTDVVEGWE